MTTRSDQLDIALAQIRATRRKYADRNRLIQWVLSGTAMALGFVGFGGLTTLWPPDIHSFLDSWYRTLGLLTIHLPRDFDDQTLPWEIQIARFLVPGMAIWISLVAYLRITRRRLRFLRLLRFREHVVIVGPGPRAHLVARQCRAHEPGTRLIYVTESEDNAAIEDLYSLGVIVVRGEAISAETYTRVGLKHARAVVVAGDKSMENIRACAVLRGVALEQRAADQPPLLTVVAADNPEMVALLDSSFHEIRDRRMEYRLLDPVDNIAQGLATRVLRQLGSPDQAPAILILGWNALAAAIHRRLLRNGPPGFQLIVADRAAELAKAALVATAPGLADMAGLRFATTDGGDPLANTAITELLATLPLTAVIVCGDSDEANFRAAVQLRRFARTRRLWTPPVFVRIQGSDLALDALRNIVAAEIIDVSRIHPFGGLAEQYAAEAVLYDRDEALAKAIHQAYVAKNPKPGPNTVPWEELLETFRLASRLQAEHIDVKLAAARCRRLPAKAPQSSAFAFSPDEVEVLARLEHWRWCVDRWCDGWIFAPERDDAVRHHNLLLSYDSLTEEIKEYDREAARNLPYLVGLAHGQVKREHLLAASDSEQPPADAAETIIAEAKRVDEAGECATVAITVARASDLDLCRRLQKRGIRVRLTMAEPFATLAGRLSPAELIAALDAADEVVAPPIVAAPPVVAPPASPEQPAPEPLAAAAASA